MRLLGTIHASSHFPVASSTTAQIGNPILYNLSCPSPDQRSWGPIGNFGARRIFLAVGSLISKPSGAWTCMISETVLLNQGRSQIIVDLITRKLTVWGVYLCCEQCAAGYYAHHVALMGPCQALQWPFVRCPDLRWAWMIYDCQTIPTRHDVV